MIKVKRVIAGDTFETPSGQRVRLAGVEAPEKGRPWSVKATQELESLIGGKNVVIDPLGASYGRIVAEVKVGGRSVNIIMKKYLTASGKRHCAF